ncbi:MAG: ribose 5-phosphate isomerase B [Bacteroidales bacterium]|nr:ribose 5-phosphate isomerase B [Bacteroidales bacterium]
MKKTIAIASDHAGYLLKDKVKALLEARGFEVEDFGTNGPDSVDYPDFAHPVASAVEQGRCPMAILICGTGNGMQIAANKHQGVRCALCWQREIAALARQHNDANIMALPARFIADDEALACVETFLDTPFEGGRHQRRVEKIVLQNS